MSRRRGRTGDLVIGVTLGILLGLAILIAFLFLASREAIDPPSVEGDGTQIERTSTERTVTRVLPPSARP